MIKSSILSLWFLCVAFVSASFIDLPKRDLLVSRGASDPCCQSCATVGKVLDDCPLDTTDIYCGCDDRVRTAPTCQTCIVNAGYNTSFALNPGPALEIFYSFCQCQKPCRKVAEAIFGPKPCNHGTNNTCVSETLVEFGEKCVRCIKETDGWLAASFRLEIELAEKYLKTKKNAVPGTLSPGLKINTCVEVC